MRLSYKSRIAQMCIRDSAGAGQHHGSQAQDRRQHIRDGDRLLLAEAHVDEPMVDMPPVGLHRVLPLGQPPDDGKANIKNRHAQDQERHGKRDDGIELEQPLDAVSYTHLPGTPQTKTAAAVRCRAMYPE